mmetsp:Transcript_68914/g.138557  ORF Transcript_68914/g.138557 Transcript_68914/m.138557 type:complete len:386 (-) Transcript_68914:136-1293(-)
MLLLSKPRSKPAVPFKTPAFLFGAACCIFVLMKTMRRQAHERSKMCKADENGDVVERSCPRGLTAIRHGHHLKLGHSTFPDGAPNLSDMGERQVGGHKTSDGKAGMLTHPPNLILKPGQSKTRFLREVAFYEEVEARRAGNGSLTLQPLYGLERFLSTYCGVVQLGNWGSTDTTRSLAACHSGDFLVFLDATAGMTLPCVLDIKIGRRTFEPDASETKRRKEFAKYPRQGEAGFRFVGSRVFCRRSDDSVSDDAKGAGKYITVGKKACLAVPPEEGLSFLRKFFVGGLRDPLDRARVIAEIAKRISELVSSFQQQTTFTFTSSSVLVIYDGAHSRGDNPSKEMPAVDVRFIDIAHVRPADGEVDESTLFGLQRLEGLLNALHFEI